MVRTPNPAPGGDAQVLSDAQVLTDAAGLPEASTEAAVPGETPDAASQDASEGGVSPGHEEEDSGTSSPARVGLFVAQGMLGRTLISCDEGRTWIHNQSMDDNAACDDPGMDCSHHAGASLGIVHTGEWFVAVWGWGKPGPVKRSRDGVNWETVLTGSFGGVVTGAGRVVLAATQARFSSDHGATFTPSAQDVWETTGYTVRRVGFAGNGDGSFLLVGNDGTQVVVTHDFGKTWVKPTQIDTDCGKSIAPEAGFAYANNTLIMASFAGGYACRSLDGGRTFTKHDMPAGPSSNILWDGEAFVGYAQGVRLRSVDGATWTATPTTPKSLHLGAVARSDTGVYVGARWGVVRNADVRLYRSEDGLTWQTLDAGAYPAGQPITAIAFGRAPADAVCP